MKTGIAVMALASVLGLTACTSQTGGVTAPSAVGQGARIQGRASAGSIAEIAAGTPDVSTLVAALDKAGLVGTFEGVRHYTVFAPTNAAFDAAAAALLGAGRTGPDLVEALDVETLTAVLTYHVTNGDRRATSVVAAGSLRMLDGHETTIAVQDGSATIDGATIVAADIVASNGIVHVIDAVILPPSLK
jgi:uncharacterized surface protein with fasciclin (FAS1) repeats